MTGFTSTSLRNYTVEQVVETAIKSKSEIIEWGSDKHILTLADAEKAGNLCRENGIDVKSFGTYYRIGSGETEQWKDLCEKAKLLGSSVLRTWLGFKGSAFTSERDYDQLVNDAVSVCDIAAEYGLTVSNECHPNTYNDTTVSSLKFISDVNRNNLKTYYQSWYREEASDKEKLYKTIVHVTDVHLSFSELIKFQAFRKKDRDYIVKIISWLNDLDFNGNILIEFTKHNTPEDMITDMEKLRKVISDVRGK